MSIKSYSRNLSLAIISSLLVTACGSATTMPTPVNLADVFQEYSAQELQWAECAKDLVEDEFNDPNFTVDGVQCTEVRIPIDYDNPAAGEDLSLTIMRDPADGSADQYQGALFMNPGGPGQSGIAYLQTAALPAEIRAAYDVYGVDPRGVGASSPVRCDDELDLRSYFEYPFDVENQAQADEVQAKLKEFYEDCIEQNPHWWAIGTRNVVKDFELLRQIVSPSEKFNFIGHSYGTTIAAQYITDFPDQVGRIVLDSPVTPDDGTLKSRLEQTKSIAESRNRIFETCALDPDCTGDSVEEVQENLLTLRDRILADETEGFVYEQMGGDAFFKEGNGESAYLVMRAIDLLTYWPTDEAYSYFVQIYEDAINTNWVGGFEFLGLFMDGYDPETLERDNSYEVLTIVNCLDIDDRDLRADSEIDADKAAFEAADPFSTEFSNLFEFEPSPEQEPGCFWSWEAFKDEAIANPPSTQATFSNTSGVEVMTIGSKGDNVTPYAWSTEVAESISSSLITYEGTGHAVLWGTSNCIDDPIIKYLLTGEGSENVTCPAK
jgi:pimeloyl-ACP methyl ester carboxylesterase